jgi:hypothetical protein
MTNQNRREKVGRKASPSKDSPRSWIYRPEVQRRKGQAGAWVNPLGNGAYQFYCKFGHSELEFQPGQKAIVVANLEGIPGVIDLVIKAVNRGYFDGQMKQSSDNLASKIKRGKKSSAAPSGANSGTSVQSTTQQAA